MIEICTTVPSEEVGAGLSDGVIERRLGACAQLSGPITSTYRWEGRIETSQEWRLIIKTTPEQRDSLVAYLQEHHPYTLPEISEHPVSWIEPEYLRWVHQQASQTDLSRPLDP